MGVYRVVKDMNFNQTGTLDIETSRLFLRRFRYNDAESMLRNWIANKEVQYNYGEPTYETIEEVQKLLKSYIESYYDETFYRWAIILKDSGENIGQIAFCRCYDEIATAEVEYCIGGKYQGNGYATEALRYVIDFSFSTPHFSKIEAFHRETNPVFSGYVLQKSGMKRVATVNRFDKTNPCPPDKICYAITIDEYMAIEAQY
jgi:ribosomal-protein-alanine N-acetyltransferase